jgi:hypothetical protein
MNIQDKARELIDAGRQEVVLDDQRLERNRARVLARAAAVGVAAAGVAGASSVGAASSAGAAGQATAGVVATKAFAGVAAAKLVVAVVAVGAAVSGGYALTQRAPSTVTVAPAAPVVPPPRALSDLATPATAAAPPEPDSVPIPSEPAAAPPAAPPVRGSASKAPASTRSLSQDAELLRDARSALSAGDATRALALLDGHREIARGALGPEWTAARILVLCRLGRVAEAKQQAGRFLKVHASSPLAAQVAASCAAP